ncbi:serine/threonine-protein kinase [Piscinibacter sp. XHJ-5]|uniref:serine/threonine-protein kinase n=1 Tax=Piscinibacter sp. XHJ-5 TaxID=3037797 RepID=UPI002452E40F|nr:serine/threonine-protein kinase [Piscinibacter sp. XHJ-5]
MKSLPRTDSPAPRAKTPSPIDTPSAPARDDALAPGSRLDEFRIDSVIGASGFGLVYLATDLGLQRRVAIKEYLPDTLAVRGDDGAQVRLRAGSHAEPFERGRRAFIEEAQLLARCDHPSLVHVLRHWESNGTVYRAMPYYPGTPLLKLRQSMDNPPDEASLRALLDGLLEPLAMLHEAGCIHREITPSKILLMPDDRPVLMDYGAARRAIVGDQARALMTLLAPSFAPLEQTQPAVNRPIGPWTDLYALASVVRYCISGQLPPPAALRTLPADEPIARLVARLQEADPTRHFSASFVAAIDAALSPRPEDRPQNVAEFRALLDDHPAAVDGEGEPEPVETGWGRITNDDEPTLEPEAPAPAPKVAPVAKVDVPLDLPARPAATAAPTFAPPAAARPASVRDTPVRDTPVRDTPVRDTPVRDTPVRDTPVRDTPLRSAPDDEGDTVPAFGYAAPPLDHGTYTNREDEPVFGESATQQEQAEGLNARPGDYRAIPPDAVLGFREAARRRRRRVAWSMALLLIGAVGAGLWYLDQQQRAVDAQSAFARAAKDDGLTANVPAVPRAPEAKPAQKPAPTPAPAVQTAPQPAAPSATAAAASAADVTLPQAPTAAVPAPSTQAPPAMPSTPAPVAPPPVEPAAVAPPVTTAAADTAATREAPAARPGTRNTVAGSGTRAPTARAAPPAKTSAAAPRTAQQAKGPRDLCGDRTQFSLYRCMQTQCAQTQWYQHPSCKRLRLRDEVD